jgi:hypothetical protein
MTKNTTTKEMPSQTWQECDSLLLAGITWKHMFLSLLLESMVSVDVAVEKGDDKDKKQVTT